MPAFQPGLPDRSHKIQPGKIQGLEVRRLLRPDPPPDALVRLKRWTKTNYFDII